LGGSRSCNQERTQDDCVLTFVACHYAVNFLAGTMPRAARIRCLQWKPASIPIGKIAVPRVRSKLLRAGATINGIEIPRQATMKSTNCFGGTAKFLTVKKTSVALVSDHGERRRLENGVIWLEAKALLLDGPLDSRRGCSEGSLECLWRVMNHRFVEAAAPLYFKRDSGIDRRNGSDFRIGKA